MDGKEMKPITLLWADKIRVRLKQSLLDEEDGLLWSDNYYVRRFIKPILEYAEAEEKRINAEFQKGKKDGKD
jgi:hemerythrin superfamily protein